ncbi:hypothetical protein QWY99_10240 [Flavobacterium branchiarum]|uniref:Uncharacterized protein n=1 Tax=Flavobacterium branchiarum TaxID=1114870 RepID=A0ABV5FT72_9FLAO|nr:hypothetical protein [Flavobacterium branchiarum]MDN3673431.1 hypothetical protein [Flavobacterium branchiarum]
MKKNLVSIKNLELNKNYWIVNGLWEFKVQEITETHVKIWIYGTSKSIFLDKNDDRRFTIEPINKNSNSHKIRNS